MKRATSRFAAFLAFVLAFTASCRKQAPPPQKFGAAAGSFSITNRGNEPKLVQSNGTVETRLLFHADSVSELRAFTDFAATRVAVAGKGIYSWDSANLNPDDGVNYIKPTSIGSSSAGRYVLTTSIAGASSTSVSVADLTALRAVSTLSDGLQATVKSPPTVVVYSASSGAGFADDGKTVFRPNSVLLASNGRWYNTAPAPVVATIAALRLAVAGVHDSISVQAYSSLGDGGGGIFDKSTCSDNGGTTIVAGSFCYQRRYSGGINLNWFGVFGDNLTASATNNTTRLNALFALYRGISGVTFIAPAGVYYFTYNLQMRGLTDVELRGEGANNTQFLAVGSSPVNRSGSAATIGATADAGAPLKTTVTGLSGANLTSADVGSSFLFSNGAVSGNNGWYLITDVLSPSSAKFVQEFGRTLTASGETNNGSIHWTDSTWLLKVVGSQGVHIRDIGFFSRSVTDYSLFLTSEGSISVNPSPPGGASQFVADGIRCTGARRAGMLIGSENNFDQNLDRIVLRHSSFDNNIGMAGAAGLAVMGGDTNEVLVEMSSLWNNNGPGLDVGMGARNITYRNNQEDGNSLSPAAGDVDDATGNPIKADIVVRRQFAAVLSILHIQRELNNQPFIYSEGPKVTGFRPGTADGTISLQDVRATYNDDGTHFPVVLFRHVGTVRVAAGNFAGPNDGSHTAQFVWDPYPIGLWSAPRFLEMRSTVFYGNFADPMLGVRQTSNGFIRWDGGGYIHQADPSSTTWDEPKRSIVRNADFSSVAGDKLSGSKVSPDFAGQALPNCGAITATSLSTGSGAISGGAITGTSIDTGTGEGRFGTVTGNGCVLRHLPATSYSGLWCSIASGSESTSNDAVLCNGTECIFNAPTDTYFRTANGTLIHTQANKLGFYAATPVVQPSRVGQTTNSTGGTPGSSCTAVDANCIATLIAKINGLEAALSAAGGGCGITQ